MKRLVALSALALVACSNGAPAPSPAPAPRLPTPAEIALQGPQKSADALTLLSHSLDSARLGAAFVAAETCAAADAPCAESRKREALEAFNASSASLELLIALRRDLFPAGPKAFGPDDAGVYARLGLAPAPKAP